jgi:hypothetical protein
MFQQTNKTNVINDKSQLSSPTSSKDFNLRTFALRLDARDVSFYLKRFQNDSK